MEICYYWTESLGYTFENKGYNFGGELLFSYSYEDKKLKVEENELNINNFFNVYSDEVIKNITAVVGRNGVGKSTFLEEIKSLYVHGAILAKADDNGQLNNHKRILVTKNENGYKIVYHKDLLTKDEGHLSNVKFNNSVPNTYDKNVNGKHSDNTTDSNKENIIYIGDNLKERYNIANPTSYSGNKVQLALGVDVVKIKEFPYLKDTSCIYFSYAFDTNFYNQRTLIDFEYFDLSTKGILNEIDYELDNGNRLSEDFDPTMPNHLSTKNNQFNIGFLREYYVRENKKRIQLLESEVGKIFIEKHKFFPTKAYLNLDYILRRQESVESLKNAKMKNFLRSERKGETVSTIENEIYNYIESIYDPKVDNEVLNLARQTYLRRILDSYFEDVNYFINYDKGRRFLIKSLSKPGELDDLDELLKTKITKLDVVEDLFNIIDHFNSRAITFLKEFSNNNKNALSDFNDKQFNDMTESYKEFISYFNTEFLNNPAIIIKEDAAPLTTFKKVNGKFEIEGSYSKRVGLVEVDLTLGGLPLLKDFLDKYNSIKTGSDFIKIDWAGLSTGENALLGMYSRFYALGKEFKKINADKAKERAKNPNCEMKDSGINLSILLDEVEHSLHPEWQRRIINDLIEFLPLAFTTAKTIQVIMATNVPFIIADIPTNNIIYLEKIDGKTQVVNKPEQTFASNIHSLLISNFFMDATIGKFSEQKIKDIVRNLGGLPDESEDHSYQLKERKKLSQDEVEQTIKAIGEPVIRTRLESMYDKHYPKDNEESEIKKSLKKLLENPDIPYNIRGSIQEIIRESDKGLKNDKD